MMTVSIRSQLIFYAFAFGLFFAFVWLFKTVLTPFVLGIAIAYLLNPLSVWLLSKGMPRWGSALLVSVSFFLFISCVIALMLPPALREASELVEAFPAHVQSFLEWLHPHLLWLQDRLGEGYLENAQAIIKENAGKLIKVGGGVLGGLASGGQAALDFITLILLTPLVTFFMMKEWPLLTQWVEDMYPKHHDQTIRGLIKEIDQKLSGFVRGQVSVAFILAVFYAIALSLADLNYGFLIGLLAGLLSIIPLVGSIFGLLASVLVALFQSWDAVYVGIIAGIFIFGQIVEGNFLTPKLIGDSVGLHPLWIMFALMAGGSLFGILGMLLAVPVAAVIGVIAGFGILQYKNSALYQKPKTKKAKRASKKRTQKQAKNIEKKDG